MGSAAQLAEKWTLVWSAPALALALMAIVAAATWWLRSTLGKSKVTALEARISATVERANTLKQRLKSAREQEQEAVAAQQKLEIQIADLQREVLFSPERVRASAKALADTVNEMKMIQSALTDTLTHSETDQLD
jgi:preprotein translocase subunit SecF